jgi:NAD(P)-dependent dehydrogenase (short-subunit alcohol dehydrogenase family)
MLPLLEKGSEKKVVNIASMLGDIGFTMANPGLNFASYSATKAGITMATAKFHNELVTFYIIFHFV